MTDQHHRLVAVLLFLLALQVVTGVRIVDSSDIWSGSGAGQEDCNDFGPVGHLFAHEVYRHSASLLGRHEIICFPQEDPFAVTYQRPPPTV